MSEKSDQLKKLVNSSGYPLQLAVEYEVQTIQTRWEIISHSFLLAWFCYWKP
jgi:hypothetical protein